MAADCARSCLRSHEHGAARLDGKTPRAAASKAGAGQAVRMHCSTCTLYIQLRSRTGGIGLAELQHNPAR